MAGGIVLGDNQSCWSSAPVVSRWLWPQNGTFLEMDSMVGSWWIVSFLPRDIFWVSTVTVSVLLQSLLFTENRSNIVHHQVDCELSTLILGIMSWLCWVYCLKRSLSKCWYIYTEPIVQQAFNTYFVRLMKWKYLISLRYVAKALQNSLRGCNVAYFML